MPASIAWLMRPWFFKATLFHRVVPARTRWISPWNRAWTICCTTWILPAPHKLNKIQRPARKITSPVFSSVTNQSRLRTAGGRHRRGGQSHFFPNGTVAENARNQRCVHSVSGAVGHHAAYNTLAQQGQIANQIQHLVAYEFIVVAQRAVAWALGV